jgi:hypothetical protein
MVRVMMFNATFNNSSIISWWSVLLVEETRPPESRQSNDPIHYKKKLEDIKGVIRSRIRRTDNTLDKRKRTNNDVQNTAQKTKDRPTTGTELAFSEGLAVLRGLSNVTRVRELSNVDCSFGFL